MSNLSLADTAEELWASIRYLLSDGYRPTVARKWVEVLEAKGCDTLMGTQLGQDAGVVHDEETGSRWAWKL